MSPALLSSCILLNANSANTDTIKEQTELCCALLAVMCAAAGAFEGVCRMRAFAKGSRIIID
jgi:hypothetical protein